MSLLTRDSIQNVDDVEDGDHGLDRVPIWLTSGLENLEDKDGKGADAEWDIGPGFEMVIMF